MDKDVWIVTPTLVASAGSMAVAQAQKTTELETHGLIVLNGVGQGGVRPANVGLKQAIEGGATHIAYINDDVWIEQEGWLERLVEVLDSNSSYAIVGPSGACLTKPQCFGKPNMEPGTEEVEQLGWFCVVLKRETLEQFGFLNEIYLHGGADFELNDKIRAGGGKLVWVKDVYVKHSLTSPTTDKGRSMRQRDKDLYYARKRRGLT